GSMTAGRSSAPLKTASSTASSWTAAPSLPSMSPASRPSKSSGSTIGGRPLGHGEVTASFWTSLACSPGGRRQVLENRCSDEQASPEREKLGKRRLCWFCARTPAYKSQNHTKAETLKPAPLLALVVLCWLLWASILLS